MKRLLILSILFILFLPAFVFAQPSPDEIGTQMLWEKTSEELEYKGFIVEFEESPLLEYKEELDKKLESLEEATESLEKEIAGVAWYDILGHITNIFRSSDLNSKKSEISRIETDTPGLLKEQENRIANLHARIKMDMVMDRITGMITAEGSDSATLSEFKNVFSGVALDVSDEAAERLKKLDYVKDVHPNYKVNITLMNSVALINADDVWKLQDSQGNNITGEGVTIAVIDTGIDYTHPDLGGSGLPYRDLEEIASDYVNPQIYNGKIYAQCGGKYCILDLETRGERVVEIPHPNFYSHGIPSVHNDILGYQIGNLNTGEWTFHLYNLTDNKDFQLNITFNQMSSYQINDKYLVFSSEQSGDSYNNIYLYDLKSKELKRLTDDNKDYYFPHIYENWIVFNSHQPGKFDSAYVYKISTQQTNLIDGESNQILEVYKGFPDKNLMPYNKRTSDGNYLMVYNVETGEKNQIFGPKRDGFYKPVISEDKIIYTKGAGTDDDIFLYDIDLEREVQITLTGNYYALPKIEGSNVILHLGDNSKTYLHLYDPSYDYPTNYTIFNEKVIGGYDFVNYDDDPMDDHGHGTHCAGTAAGKGVLKGVAPDAKLYAYKVLDSYGSGWGDDIIAGIDMAVDPNNDGDFSDHVDVISMSLGGPGNPEDPMSIAVDNAVEAGVVAAVAAGNYGGFGYETILSPGTSRKAITVGATDKYDRIADFSSKGPVVWENGSASMVKPDVTAPGVYICAAQWDGAWDEYRCLDDEHTAISGTSMATPHVAGAAGLLRQKNPDWTPDEIKMALRNNAIDIGEPIYIQGHGRIDILEAINLENPPPIAILKPGGTFTETLIDINGTAMSEDFDKYVIYYGEGRKPTSWNEIYTGSQSLDDGLMFTWDTEFVVDGEYFLKLVVHGKDGQSSADYTPFTINHLEILSPKEECVYGIHDPISIEGYILYQEYRDYNLEYNCGEGWSSEGITKTNQNSGVLAFWNSISATSEKYCTLKLSTYLSENIRNEETVRIYLDPTLKRGWPRGTSDDLSSFNPPIISDINGDGKEEIIVGGGYTHFYPNDTYGKKFYPNGMIHVFDHEGEELEGWPVSFLGLPEQPTSVGDLDNDGKKEIVVSASRDWRDYNTTRGGMYVYDYTGDLLWSKKFENGQDRYLWCNTMVDLDNDGYQEIIVQTYPSNKVRTIDYQGTELWNIEIDNHIKGYTDGCFGIGNLKGGDENYISFMTEEGNIYILDTSGNMIYNKTGLTGTSNLALGDIDNDDVPEIIFSVRTGTGISAKTNVSYIDYVNGSFVYTPMTEIDQISNDIALGDIDNDGKLDVVIVGVTYPPLGKCRLWTDKVMAINGDGEVIFDKIIQGLSGTSPLIIAEVNGDEYPEILLPGWDCNSSFDAVISFRCKIFGLDYEGNFVEGFPKTMTHWPCMIPAVGDLDDDGVLDVFSYDSYSLYAWSLDGSYNKSKMEWPMFMHDPQNTGLYGWKETEPPPPPNKTEISIDIVTFNLTKPIIKVRNSGTFDVHISNVEVNSEDVPYTIDSILLEPAEAKNIYVEKSYREGEMLGIFVNTLEGVSDSKSVRVPRGVKPKEISVEDITFSMLRLEALYAEFISVEKALREIGDYYKSIGDLEKANEYYAVADMVLEAMGKIDEMKALVNVNIDNLEDIGDEFYQLIEDLKELVDDIINQIGILKASM